MAPKFMLAGLVLIIISSFAPLVVGAEVLPTLYMWAGLLVAAIVITAVLVQLEGGRTFVEEQLAASLTLFVVRPLRAGFRYAGVACASALGWSKRGA